MLSLYGLLLKFHLQKRKKTTTDIDKKVPQIKSANCIDVFHLDKYVVGFPGRFFVGVCSASNSPMVNYPIINNRKIKSVSR